MHVSICILFYQSIDYTRDDMSVTLFLQQSVVCGWLHPSSLAAFLTGGAGRPSITGHEEDDQRRCTKSSQLGIELPQVVYPLGENLKTWGLVCFSRWGEWVFLGKKHFEPFGEIWRDLALDVCILYHFTYAF